MTNAENASTEQDGTADAVSRRKFMGIVALSGAQLTPMAAALDAERSTEQMKAEEIKKEKIRRAMLAGPSSVTADATVADMDHQGTLTVLRPGKNEWVCVPGDQNIVGRADMAIDPIGMIWWKDLLARKPKPTNTAPGLTYMLNGATQRSFTDPFDTTSPPIPIGPHWMLLWPFNAKAAGLSTVMRDAGTMVMFAGTPYAHLHICGSPWEGNEYRPGDLGVWTMKYQRP